MKHHQDSSTAEDRRAIHHKIARYIKDHAHSCYQKKHGAFRVFLITPTFWFLLDDFNYAMSLHWGPPPQSETSYYQHSQNLLCYLGLDFGGYESKLTYAQYREILQLLK